MSTEALTAIKAALMAPSAWRWSFDNDCITWHYDTVKPDRFTWADPNAMEPLYSLNPSAISSLIVAYEAMERRVAELEAALKPMAEVSRDIPASWEDEHQCVTMCGHFRRAAAALTPTVEKVETPAQIPSPQTHTTGDGEAAIIECLAAGQNFVFDPATNFLHADDGTIQGIRYLAENGDLPQSPWPASDWAIDRIAKLEAALKPFAEAASRFDAVPLSEALPQQCWFSPHSLREARAVLATTESQL